MLRPLGPFCILEGRLAFLYICQGRLAIYLYNLKPFRPFPLKLKAIAFLLTIHLCFNPKTEQLSRKNRAYFLALIYFNSPLKFHTNVTIDPYASYSINPINITLHINNNPTTIHNFFKL